MPSSDLLKLQKAVTDLQSIPPLQSFLPKENAVNQPHQTTTTTSTKTLLSTYKSARQSYLQSRATELFLEHLAQYDPHSNSLQSLPVKPTPEELSALKSRQQSVLRDISHTMQTVNSAMDEIKSGYDTLKEKREEFVGIVEGMERQHQQHQQGGESENDGMEEEDTEEMITEEEVAQEEDHLKELQQRKTDLENRLRAVRAQIINVEEECHRTQEVVNEVRGRTGKSPLDWRGFPNDDGEESDDREYMDVQADIDEMQEKAAELRQSEEFYDGIRELMEELGGVKILSSKASTKDDGGFTLTLLLLGSHVLEIRLQSKKNGENDSSHLVVESAKLTTPTTFPMPETTRSSSDANNNEETQTMMTDTINQSLSNISLSKIMSQKQTVSITIPPLDDLVTWSHSLDSSQGIRFVLVETMARLRTLDARVVELTYLRNHYAAQVYDIETSFGGQQQQQQQFGGAEQEVVCAINEGITVAMRLCVDCPLVPGSVYVSEMVGVGGWEEERLEVLKKVVGERRCKGPVEVMEVLVKEIRRRKAEEGWAIPLTPSLPRGGGGGK